MTSAGSSRGARWLFDDELLVFLVFARNGLVVDRPTVADPSLIARCRASFERAWGLSIPHHEYKPTVFDQLRQSAIYGSQTRELIGETISEHLQPSATT
jgi:hypothetical protein